MTQQIEGLFLNAHNYTESSVIVDVFKNPEFPDELKSEDLGSKKSAG